MDNEISPAKEFRIKIAKLRRVVGLLIANLVNESRPRHLASIVNQVESQKRVAARYGSGFVNSSDSSKHVNDLNGLFRRWTYSLNEYTQEMERNSPPAPSPLGNGDFSSGPKIENIKDSLLESLQEFDEGLVQLRAASKHDERAMSQN